MIKFSKASISAKNRIKNGTQPTGWKLTEEQKRKHAMYGDKNPSYKRRDDESFAWTGDKVGYIGVHQWVQLHLGKPKYCEICKSENKKMYDWANKNHKYRRNIEDYMRLCRSCHRLYDIKYNNYRNQY